MLLAGLTLALTLSTPMEVDLPGTQPHELASPPQATSGCNCHLAFTDTFTEPGKTYRATAMALAPRDPIFRAALKIAHRDHPELSDLCLRCHAPVAWLAGRSVPGDARALLEDDLSGVSCDVCHRMIPEPDGVPLIGDGQYTIAADPAVKRARRGSAPPNGHQVEASSFIGSAQMCGRCHSLFNPAETGYLADGTSLGGAYYEQRTYEEWKGSRFSEAGGKTCIDCHMQRGAGKPARDGQTYPDLALHTLVGANSFLPQAVDLVDPNYPLFQELPYVLPIIQATLRSSATLTVTSTPAPAYSGSDLSITVRLTNKTGHKLPTGYPEGRRVYLEVVLALDGAGTSTISGRWDRATGVLVPDPQLRTYETQHGRYEGGASVRTHHLIEMNQVRLDTRLPPEGFVPSAPDMIPAGRDYGAAAPYRHFDDVTYRVPAPEVAARTTGRLTVRARYQLIDGEVLSFLTETAGSTSAESLALGTAWELLDHAPPELITQVSVPVVIDPAPPRPDAGPSAVDAGVVDAAGLDAGAAPSAEEGCTCLDPEGGRSGGRLALLVLFGAAVRIVSFRRRGSRSGSR